MPSESLSVRLTGINSASNGIDGGTGCNFIFFAIKYNYIDQSVVCVADSFLTAPPKPPAVWLSPKSDMTRGWLRPCAISYNSLYFTLS